jgi:hypothetical protein
MPVSTGIQCFFTDGFPPSSFAKASKDRSSFAKASKDRSRE